MLCLFRPIKDEDDTPHEWKETRYGTHGEFDTHGSFTGAYQTMHPDLGVPTIALRAYRVRIMVLL